MVQHPTGGPLSVTALTDCHAGAGQRQRPAHPADPRWCLPEIGSDAVSSLVDSIFLWNAAHADEPESESDSVLTTAAN